MKVPSTKVKNNFGKYLKYAEVNEEIIITRTGKEIARMIPFDNKKSELNEEAIDYKTSNKWVTYEEFMELSENSEQRFELIDGVIYNLASPSFNHQLCIREILGTFYNWFKGKPCVPLTSPFDVTLFKSEKNICVVQPDIVVVCDREKVNKKGRYKGVPTLVVEVLSPSTRSKDMLKKLDLYKTCNVSEYWIVDIQNKTVTVYILKENDIKDAQVYKKDSDESVKSSFFKGLEVNMIELFES
jgi:prevent-host-death family protein